MQTPDQPETLSAVVHALSALNAKPVCERDYFPCAYCGKQFTVRADRYQHETDCGTAERTHAEHTHSDSETPVCIVVDRKIPLAEIALALNAFGFSVAYKHGDLTVRYAPKDESRSEAMRHRFLDQGMEP